MNKLALALIASLSFAAANSASAGQWVTLPDTGFVSGDPTLTLTMPYVQQAFLSVKSSEAGDLKWIETSVPITMNEAFKGTKRIDKVMLCYKTPNPGTFISQIRLAQYAGPTSATVMSDDGTDLTSPTDQCYVSSFPAFRPEKGAIHLALRLFFADPSHKIWIGATAVHFK